MTLMKSLKVNNYTTRKVLIRNGKDFFLSYTGEELVWDWVNLNDVWLCGFKKVKKKFGRCKKFPRRIQIVFGSVVLKSLKKIW